MKRLICGLFLILTAGTAGAAEQHAPVARGTAGLTPFSVTAINETGAPLSCGAALAHWYAQDLGTVAAGGRIAIPLWADAAKGGVFLLNASQDNMPVQSLWCGRAGNDWATRSDIVLERRAGVRPADLALACKADGNRVVCR